VIAVDARGEIAAGRQAPLSLAEQMADIAEIFRASRMSVGVRTFWRL
jgi:hypothetical protein